MSGAIVIEGIDRYVPEIRGLRERIFVIRERSVDPHSSAQVSALEQSLSIPQVSCGGAAKTGACFHGQQYAPAVNRDCAT